MTHTYGSRGIAAYRWRRLLDEHGPEHPATRAAHGRLLALATPERVPQRLNTSIESIAWHRERGAIPGFMNRSERNARGVLPPRVA